MERVCEKGNFLEVLAQRAAGTMTSHVRNCARSPGAKDGRFGVSDECRLERDHLLQGKGLEVILIGRVSIRNATKCEGKSAIEPSKLGVEHSKTYARISAGLHTPREGLRPAEAFGATLSPDSNPCRINPESP